MGIRDVMRWPALLLASTALVSVSAALAQSPPVGGSQPVGSPSNAVQFAGPPPNPGDCIKAFGGPFIQGTGAPCGTGGGGATPGGATNAIQFNNAGAFGGLGIVNNGIVVTNGSGVPSESTNLPTTVQSNITQLGTITSGIWNGGIVPVGSGGTGQASFSTNSPIIGAGGGALTVGLVSGNTTKFATVTGSLSLNDCLTIDSSGNLKDFGSACGASAAGATNSIQFNSGGGTFAAVGVVNSAVLITSAGGAPSESTNLPTTVQGNITQLGTITSGIWNGTTIGVGNGGTGLVTGSSGGVLTFTTSNTLASSAALTTNNPIIGGGAGNVISVGSRTGNTTLFATATGSFSNGDCVQIDGSGNFKDALVPCGGTGSSGTVTAGLAGQIGFYSTNSTIIVGNANLTITTGSVTVGQAGSVTGSVTVQNGAASGQGIKIQNLGTTNTYNFNLPTTAGTANQPLISAGGTTNSMVYGSLTGNTALFVTSTGSLVTNDCVKIDASGNFVDSGAACAGAAAIASNTVLGNVTSTNSVPTALTASQLTTLVNVFTSSLSGAAPAASGNDPSKFLSAAKQWTNTLTQTNQGNNLILTLNNSAATGSFLSGIETINSARTWLVGSYGAASGLNPSGEYAIFDETASKVRFSIGPTGTLNVWDSAGAVPTGGAPGAGIVNVPTAGGMDVNSAVLVNASSLIFSQTNSSVTANGILVNNTAASTPYVGSYTGFYENGVNIFGYGPNTPAIDDAYQYGLPAASALTRNTGISQTSHDITQNIIHNDQLSAGPYYVGVVGGASNTNFSVGDTAAWTIAWNDTTFGPSGTATISCLVHSNAGLPTTPNCDTNGNGTAAGTSAATIVSGLAYQSNRATATGSNAVQAALMAGRVFFDAQNVPVTAVGCTNSNNCMAMLYEAPRSSVAAGGFSIGGAGTHPSFYTSVSPVPTIGLDSAGFINYRLPPAGAPAGKTQTASISIASPGVFTAASHGLTAGLPVTLATTGALPTNLSINTPYYVIASGLTANNFELSATVGGAPINTTGSQSGVQTVLSGWQQYVNDDIYTFAFNTALGQTGAQWALFLDNVATGASRAEFIYGNTGGTLGVGNGVVIDLNATVPYNGLGTLTFDTTGGIYWGTQKNLSNDGMGVGAKNSGVLDISLAVSGWADGLAVIPGATGSNTTAIAVAGSDTNIGLAISLKGATSPFTINNFSGGTGFQVTGYGTNFVQASGGTNPTLYSSAGSLLLGGSGVTSLTVTGTNTSVTGTLGLAPATWTGTQSCVTGQVSVDASFIYVCTATNVAKRAALSSF